MPIPAEIVSDVEVEEVDTFLTAREVNSGRIEPPASLLLAHVEKMKRAMKIYTASSIVVIFIGTVIVTFALLPPVINSYILVGIACIIPTSIVSFVLTHQKYRT